MMRCFATRFSLATAAALIFGPWVSVNAQNPSNQNQNGGQGYQGNNYGQGQDYAQQGNNQGYGQQGCGYREPGYYRGYSQQDSSAICVCS